MTKPSPMEALREKQALREKELLASPATKDSFQNFLANMGIGTDNLSSASTYGFNPISRERTLLEWIHRGSWIGGVAVDLVADDMTRAGIDFSATLPPDDAERLQGVFTRTGIWEAINDTIKWARLYGGCLAVSLIDGQKMNTPLRIETVGKDQFKGLCVLDRWMVEPSLNDLVTDYGPDMGLPKFYRVTVGAPGLSGQRIHYSRVMRLEGIRLPYMQRIMENLWGISVYERLYDRMVAFDSATQGASQLVYKSYLRYIKLKDFREALGAMGDPTTGNAAVNGVTRYLDMMRRFQSIEGLTVIDKEDEFGAQTHTAFSGLSDALMQFGQQLAGALQIPLVRLFGQSPSGLNSSGDSDLRTYYDGIKHQQERHLKTPVDRIIQCAARSERIELPERFNFEFNSLWQLTPQEKAQAAQQPTAAILDAQSRGTIDWPTALRELRHQSKTTGVFTNITDEMIDEAEAEPPPLPPSSGRAEVTGVEPSSPEGAMQQLPGEEERPFEETAQPQALPQGGTEEQ